MATALPDLPKYLVLEPVSTVRIEVELAAPACEIDVELDNPKSGRSFVLLIGQVGGPYVQRVRLAGRARIFFDPQRPGAYEILLANPQREPVVLRMRGRNVGEIPRGPARTSRLPTVDPEKTAPSVTRRGRRPSSRRGLPRASPSGGGARSRRSKA